MAFICYWLVSSSEQKTEILKLCFKTHLWKLLRQTLQQEKDFLMWLAYILCSFSNFYPVFLPSCMQYENCSFWWPTTENKEVIFPTELCGVGWKPVDQQRFFNVKQNLITPHVTNVAHLAFLCSHLQQGYLQRCTNPNCRKMTSASTQLLYVAAWTPLAR